MVREIVVICSSAVVILVLFVGFVVLSIRNSGLMAKLQDEEHKVFDLKIKNAAQVDKLLILNSKLSRPERDKQAMWEITAYNGTVWESKEFIANIYDLIAEFKRKTGLHEMDIKSIVNKQ